MTDLYAAAGKGDLKQVILLLDQGAEKDETVGATKETALLVAAGNGYLDIVRYLVEQGADMKEADTGGDTPLMYASAAGEVDVARYLLEQGADRDKVATDGYTSLHCAAEGGHLDTAKLLMVYGADLNARNNAGRLPIDVARTEEIKQAIRDEPRRRIDEAPGKRATEQDRHPNAAHQPRYSRKTRKRRKKNREAKKRVLMMKRKQWVERSLRKTKTANRVVTRTAIEDNSWTTRHLCGRC